MMDEILEGAEIELDKIRLAKWISGGEYRLYE
jgi:hypothetical protein